MRSLHEFIQFVIYKWKAKGRHGTHSPFVYDFLEHILRNKEVIDRQYIVEDRDIALRYENLVSRTATRYGYKNVVSAGQGNKQQEIDMLLLGKDAARWQQELNSYLPQIKNDGAVIVKDIHKTAANTGAWNKLCADERVLLSIDMFGIGMLFFRKEFKEKQHFVLAY